MSRERPRFPSLRWSKDTALVAQTPAPIRRNLKGRPRSEALPAYFTLWALEAPPPPSDQQARNLRPLQPGRATLFLAATKSYPDGQRTLPPEPIEIAQALAERGVVEDIPELVFAGFSAVERGFSPNHANDVLGRSAADLRRQRDQMNFWGYNALCEAYIRLGRLASAKDLLSQQDVIVNRLRPSETATAGDK